MFTRVYACVVYRGEAAFVGVTPPLGCFESRTTVKIYSARSKTIVRCGTVRSVKLLNCDFRNVIVFCAISLAKGGGLSSGGPGHEPAALLTNVGTVRSVRSVSL